MLDVLQDFVKKRYASWDSGAGADIEAGKMRFGKLRDYIVKKGNIAPNSSGRVEMLENIFNDYVQ